MLITVLGCGHSGGTPQIGGDWGNCDPDNPKNTRLRPSILVQEGDTTILVDTSPDLRAQLITAQIDRLDAIIYTHGHADHLHGIDDLRAINRLMQSSIVAYGDAATAKDIRERFGYVVTPLDPVAKWYYKPCIDLHQISAGDKISIGDMTVETFDQDHGFMRTLGLRFGDFAYSTDVVNMPEESFAVLHGVNIWMIGTLQTGEHPTHAHVDKSLNWIERVGPDRAVLTHLSHRVDYAELAASLPSNVEPAYDGMRIKI